MTDPRAHAQGSGQALPLFAIFAPVILAFMAFGLDAAQVFLERRDAQGAADLAALSGARELPDDPTSAIATADSIGVANGYSAAQVVPVTPYSGQDTLIEVTITTDVDTFFMPILDFFVPGDYSAMTVSARAVAEAEQGWTEGDAYAIFTLQPCGSSDAYKSVDWSGSGSTVTGAIHSSGGILVGGSNNAPSGTITLECTNSQLGGKDAWEEGGSNPAIPNVPKGNVPVCPGATVVHPCREDRTPPPLPTYASFKTTAPCDFTGNPDFDVTGASSSAPHWVSKSSGTIKAGKYCSNGLLKISGSGIKVVDFGGKSGISLAANKIDISGSDFKLAPAYDQGILAFANSVDSDAIKLAGSNATPPLEGFEGILYAPSGGVDLSGSDNSTLEGAIVAHRVKLAGQNMNIIGTYAEQVLGEQTLALIE